MYFLCISYISLIPWAYLFICSSILLISYICFALTVSSNRICCWMDDLPRLYYWLLHFQAHLPEKVSFTPFTLLTSNSPLVNQLFTVLSRRYRYPFFPMLLYKVTTFETKYTIFRNTPS